MTYLNIRKFAVDKSLLSDGGSVSETVYSICCHETVGRHLGLWLIRENVVSQRDMSHKAIYRQPVPGNLQEEKPFTFQCSPIFLVDYKILFENQLMGHRSGPVACTEVGCLQVGCKSCLV